MDALTTELSCPLLKLDKKHRYLLQWFFDHNSDVVPWFELNDEAFRLANRAKGIYCPKDNPYALSVKHTLGSPYADSLPRPNAQGGYTYSYHQESQERTAPDRLSGNKGLAKCMEDGVPVGVLIQATPKPHVTYTVWGLAMVRNWESGVFTLEGIYARKGTLIDLDAYRTDPGSGRRIAEPEPGHHTRRPS